MTVACSLPFNSVADIRRWEGQTERCCRAQDDIAQLQRQTLEAVTFVKGVRTQSDPASVLSEQRMTESDVDNDFTTRRECAAGYLRESDPFHEQFSRPVSRVGGHVFHWPPTTAHLHLAACNISYIIKFTF